MAPSGGVRGFEAEPEARALGSASKRDAILEHCAARRAGSAARMI